MYNPLFILSVKDKKFLLIKFNFFHQIVTEIQGTTREISADKCRKASLAVRQLSIHII
jgi:hypothetical protein